MADSRISIFSPAWKFQRKGLFIGTAISAILLQLLILGNMSYLYGSSFQQSKRAKNLDILVVDFDGGAVGSAVVQASQSINGSSYPRIDVVPAQDQYEDAAAVKHAVCKADYWAAIYINQGASNRLRDVVTATNAATNASDNTYNPAAAVSYVYNEARYPVVADSVLITSINTIVEISRDVYYQTPDGKSALASLNTSSVTAAAAFLRPIAATPDLIMPTTHVSRVFYNTVNIVIPPLAQFFFIMALNGVGLQTGLLSTVRVRDVWLFRFSVGKVYTLVSALVNTGYIWAFRETWAVDSAMFGKTWMLLWLLMDIHYQVMETLIASFIPVQFTPFFFFTWIISNVASCVFPYEINAGFYRIGFALPSFGAYTVLVQIWSGCANKLHIALPVMFTWWLVFHITAVMSVRRRCADALVRPTMQLHFDEKTVDNSVAALDEPTTNTKVMD